jgi:hypothetical protein
MVTGFFPREELDLDIPGLIGRKYASELGRTDFVEVTEPVRKVPDDIFL